MKRPSEKDEEFEPTLADPRARALVEQLTQRLLAFAETTSKEEDNRRYFFARGHEFAAILAEHGRAYVDIQAPRPGTMADGGGSLRQRLRDGAHREGWVLVPLETAEDVRAAEEIARLGYEEVLGTAPTIAVRKERPLESFAGAPPAKKPATKAAAGAKPRRKK